MNMVLIINDSLCKKELDSFLKKNAQSVVAKTEINKAFKNIERFLSGVNAVPATPGLIAINSASNVNILKVNDIMHCESSRSYTYVYLKSGEKLTVTKSLREFEEALVKHRFMRIHQSHLVNINYVIRYVKGEGGYVILDNNIKLPVATRKKEFLLNELQKLINFDKH